MKTARLIALVLFSLVLASQVRAESFLSMDPSAFPAAVKDLLQDVRHRCREAGHRPLDVPGLGITILDLNGDGSRDILLQAWQVCDFPTKEAGCNTGGCEMQIFKQVGKRRWTKIFDETLDPQIFLSASKEGHLNLMAVSVSHKIKARCPDPSGNECDYLVYWKKNGFVWERIR